MKSWWMSLFEKSRNMKIAYVHDWLVFFGGAEKVFFDIVQGEMSQVWDKTKFQEDLEEKIFTSFYNPDFKNPTQIPVEAVKSDVNIWKYYRNFMPIFPYFQKKLSKKINDYKPDIVVISSFAIAKNIDVKGTKILYLHSPMQYIWSHYDEYVEKFSWPKKLIYKISSKYLRKWDKKYKNFDKIYFNSNYTKQLFKEIYGKIWNEVIHPIVQIPQFSDISTDAMFNIEWEYFIYIWRLVKLVKHVDEIIKVFNKNGKQLIIVWDGPDKAYLQDIAKENIKFLWYLDSNSPEYWNLLEKAKALINITKESFWIVNFQASLANTPIISMNHWAIQDIPWKKYFIEKISEIDKILAKI